ncbi:hypothetical protein A3A75_01425 [Candidatus Woesebacteria bacterium RIFCSPLOWO2_01_FULL_39_10]|uniref:SCP domain-containing protein n=2 Tax=Candidatus Woeseibacteriota TaxID=1752722 RepID=A0A1F8B9I5_9BACT|nr:MAG: hypothetical protein A3A75_01425 [Candidatus Woesebacteria bacterium RIFCSPLOWO2_01_FULL_39_10]
MAFVYVLTHYLFPSHSNNHKAKLIHTSTLFLITIFLVMYQVVLQVFPITGVKILGYAANIPPDEIIKLANQKRTEAGMNQLGYNANLSEAARKKGEHMLQYDYWAHTAPDGTEPWDFFSDSGYKYRYAGENLARDFSNPNDAVEAWMASPSHKENMLSSKYKEIGVAVVEGDLGGVDTTIIVQFFGTQLVDTSSQVPIAQAQPQVAVAPIATIPPSVTPTPEVSPTEVQIVAFVSPNPSSESLLTLKEPVQEKAGGFQFLISPFESTRGIAGATTIVLLAIMVVDGIVVSRRKIPRLGGRTFAHVAFLGMILAILLIARVGKIL